MKSIWAGSLSLALGIIIGNVHAQESNPRTTGDATATEGTGLSSAITLGAPVAAVTLGQPMPLRPASDLDQPAVSDQNLVPAAFHVASAPAADPLIRGQNPDPSLPGLPPPPSPVGNIPAAPEEGYNSGVVTTNPTAASQPGFWGKCQHWFGGVCDGAGSLTGKLSFQSDHGFDFLASPVTNPFMFEDPRALTEVRPIFIHQGTPTKNPVFRGGDIDFFGTEARVAVTDRISFVLSEIGLVWIEPHHASAGFSDAMGLSELRVGPKYTFYRSEQSGTIAAAGLNFDIPTGDSKVFQNTGSLSLEPYVSVAQNFGRSSFGTFDFMSTLGYSFATDSMRTDYLFGSLHLDYDVANIHKIYPLVELNWFYNTTSGKAHNFGFEGRDLFNFGSSGVSNESTITMAAGARYKFSENVQTGIAVELPVNGRHDLIDYRVTFDLIFRY